MMFNSKIQLQTHFQSTRFEASKLLATSQKVFVHFGIPSTSYNLTKTQTRTCGPKDLRENAAKRSGAGAQQVRLHGNVSGPTYTCTRRVPERPVLGPFLFTLYTRALPQYMYIRKSQSLLHADNTSLYCANKTPESAISILESDISSVTQFLLSKGLVLNASKTQFLLLRQKISVFSGLSLVVDQTAMHLVPLPNILVQ